MGYIRSYYGVPAKRGGRVRLDGRSGTIVGTRNQWLRVRLDGDKRPVTTHPIRRVEYEAEAEAPPSPASAKSWQRGYNLVGLAEVEPVCALLAAERPPGWVSLVLDLRGAMARAELKRFPPTAFKFWPGDQADVLGRALSAVRKRKEPCMTIRLSRQVAERQAEALAEEYATVRVGLDQSGDLVAECFDVEADESGDVPAGAEPATTVLLDGCDPTVEERA
jgi:hypothetical protein